MKLELVVDNTQEFMQDLFDQLIEHGYTAKEAEGAIKKKMGNEVNILKIRNTAQLLKITPLKYLDLPSDPKLANEYLEELGYNTRKFRWAIDVCCYKWGNSIECGEVVVGSERTDKKWINKRVDGVRMCSDEALLYNSGIDLREMGYLR
jgi:hypothetical protein